MSRPTEISNEEVFLSKMGMSKHVLKESAKELPQPTTSESMSKPEDFTLEEVSLSKMGMSKRSLKDTPSKPQ
ncbi:MAG: hypothetical protein WCF23_03105 [Candidatus Nitrosopolaris sp.]